MGMKYITIIISFLLAGTFVSGQNYTTGQRQAPKDALGRLMQKESYGRFDITFDTLIVENYNKLLVKNSKNPGVEGYRIRIFSDNGYGARESQQRVKADFLSLYPDIKMHDGYDKSYYKIYVGDFRTKRDALKVLNRIKRNFPESFIVEDKIVLED